MIKKLNKTSFYKELDTFSTHLSKVKGIVISQSRFDKENASKEIEEEAYLLEKIHDKLDDVFSDIIDYSKKYLEESNEPKEICTVFIGDGMYDNDFTFFDDGKIYREWDENKWNYNLKGWISPDSIRNSHKSKILKKLDGETLKRVSEILYPKEDNI